MIGGTHVFVPEGEQYIMLYGYNLDLKGTLEPTGIGIDGTLFMTRETADELAKWSRHTAVQPLTVPADSVSSVLVKVGAGRGSARRGQYRSSTTSTGWSPWRPRTSSARSGADAGTVSGCCW